jgi:hypothetical protein
MVEREVDSYCLRGCPHRISDASLTDDVELPFLHSKSSCSMIEGKGPIAFGICQLPWIC